MRLVQVLIGVVVALLGLVVSWIGADLSADFADLGQVAVSSGDDGSIPAFLLIPLGLLLAAAGVTTAILARAVRARR